MQVIDWIFLVLGVFCIVWGIYSLFVKKFSKQRLEQYTKESLIKYANIEGALTIVSGVGIVLAGLANSEAVLPKTFLYVGWVMVIIVLIVEFIAEPKILKKINTEKKD